MSDENADWKMVDVCLKFFAEFICQFYDFSQEEYAILLESSRWIKITDHPVRVIL